MAGKKPIWKWMVTTLWIAIGIGSIVLLVAAMRKKDHTACSKVLITIKDSRDNFFIDEKDVLAIISNIAGGNPVGKPAGNLELQRMETAIEKEVWVLDAQLYVDNNSVLKVIVTEREPVARVFTTAGTTYYLDSNATRLPLSEKFSARLPVFTNCPADKAILSAADSVLLKDIQALSRAIAKDSFCMALIEQVDITPNRSFEMIPKVGRGVIVFGDATNVDKKLQKLKVFYRQVVAKAGWNYYSGINLQYEGQVVATRRGAADITADSLRTVQLMQAMALAAEQRASDSLLQLVPDSIGTATDTSMIQQSLQRDEDGTAPAANIPPTPAAQPVQQPAATVTAPATTAPATNAPAVRQVAPAATRPAPQPVRPAVQRPPKPGTGTQRPPPPKPKPQQPRAVMPPKNDY